MTAKIIDGELVASRIRDQIADATEKMAREQGFRPGLATVLVGDNPSSRQYVRMKQNRCKKVGILSFGYNLPEESGQDEIEDLVRKLGNDPKIHGILVQLP
ncbi:MAG: bifunctional methylenetetrahydrofolate dehydrogenase/methenyltetrahydrofolate cyclohydrolase, partial [Candidatus Aminicenantes bacterium]|nr:bifunctional methylenetetrahydrofolate dehydrogenase/methenyltetrahydrofolate cyclohydrolase [Candidatus Aminicenantes bacterium]